MVGGRREDVSDIIFTSGTTGFPKGVILRHGSSLRAYEVFNQGARVGEGDVALIALPFFHTFGYKAGWMLNLMQGATTVPIAVFDPDVVLESIQRERVTHMPGSPTMFIGMLDHPRCGDYDLSSLRQVTVSASTVPVDLIHRLLEELSLDVMGGYGLTESHGIVSLTRARVMRQRSWHRRSELRWKDWTSASLTMTAMRSTRAARENCSFVATRP